MMAYIGFSSLKAVDYCICTIAYVLRHFYMHMYIYMNTYIDMCVCMYMYLSKEV